MEFVAELYDFLKNDVSRWHPDLYPLCKVKIIEATGHILGSFNHSLVNYVESLFESRDIDVLTGTVVQKIKENVAYLSGNSTIKFGLLVWSTGIKQVPENLSADVIQKHPRGGRMKIGPYLRLLDPNGKHLDFAFAMPLMVVVLFLHLLK